MNKRTLERLGAIALLLALCALAAGQRKPIRVLFLGNSATYFNNLPQVFKDLAESAKPSVHVDVKLVADGGLKLKDHWLGAGKKAIESAHWDYVVLQEQSSLGQSFYVN